VKNKDTQLLDDLDYESKKPGRNTVISYTSRKPENSPKQVVEQREFGLRRSDAS